MSDNKTKVFEEYFLQSKLEDELFGKKGSPERNIIDTGIHLEILLDKLNKLSNNGLFPSIVVNDLLEKSNQSEEINKAVTTLYKILIK